MTTMNDSREQQALRRRSYLDVFDAQVPIPNRIHAYFRVFDGPGRENSVHWYKIVLAEEDDKFYINKMKDARKIIPFSKTDQPLDSSTVALNSILYSLGGRSPRGSSSTTVHSYDTTSPNPQWKTDEPMLLPRRGPQLMAVDGKIFVMGGCWCYKDDGGRVWAEERDPERDYQKFMTNWAEFYDPASREWKPVRVRKVDGKEYEDPLPSLLQLIWSDDFGCDIIYPCCKLIKRGLDEIVICSWNSFVYHVKNQTLTTIKTGNLFEDYLDSSPSPPLLIGDVVYAFDWESGSVAAYNFYEGDLKENLGRIINDEVQDVLSPITFRRDDLSGDKSAKRVHFLWLEWHSAKVDGNYILNLTTVIPAPGKLRSSVKRTYLSIPSSGRICSNGILL